MNLFIILLIMITLTNSSPLKGLNQQIHGIIVEKEIPVNEKYPEPTFVAPLIIEGHDVVQITAKDPSKPGHVGYVPAGRLQAQLMSLDYFKKHYKYPDNVGFKLVPDAKPFFGMQ